jgi:type IV secretory pathway TrbD component
VKLKKLAVASFALTALFVAMPVAVGKASPASAALAFAIAAALVAAILRDAARRGLTDKKLEKAVNPGAVIFSGFWAGILAEGLDTWLRNPLDIFLTLLNAVAVASMVGFTLMLYRIGLSEAEAPEAEERELTPEDPRRRQTGPHRQKTRESRQSGRRLISGLLSGISCGGP